MNDNAWEQEKVDREARLNRNKIQVTQHLKFPIDFKIKLILVTYVTYH